MKDVFPYGNGVVRVGFDIVGEAAYNLGVGDMLFQVFNKIVEQDLAPRVECSLAAFDALVVELFDFAEHGLCVEMLFSLRYLG